MEGASRGIVGGQLPILPRTGTRNRVRELPGGVQVSAIKETHLRRPGPYWSFLWKPSPAPRRWNSSQRRAASSSWPRRAWV
jgi:hypothetical protein